MKILSPKYPNLKVSDIGVVFVEGVAEVADKKKISKLKAMTAFGFVFEKGEEVGGEDVSLPWGETAL